VSAVAKRAFVRVAGLATVVCALSACSSMRDFFLGQNDEASSRAPASVVDASVSETNTQSSSDGRAPASVQPATLGANENANEIRLNDDRAHRGYRSNSDPWLGTASDNEGSLWNGETQDNFYFSRNNQFKVGDFVIMKLDNDLSESLNLKMATLYQPDHKSTRTVVAEEAGKAAGDKIANAVAKVTGNANVGAAVGADVADRAIASIDGNEKLFDLQEVPLRITEVLPRGGLRVEGTKKIFKKNVAFDLKVEGTIRDEDIGPSRTIASSRLMESKVELTK
jgi:flagellar basal body L-ring protein FlgH